MSVGSAAPLLELRELTKRYAGTVALDRVSLELRAGEVHALIGANGAGKSTLVKMLAGDIQPSTGEIRIDGEPATFETPQDALAAGIATIPQDLVIAPDLTVAENIALGREQRLGGLPGSVSRGKDEHLAAAVLARVGAGVMPGARVGSLSFAERQMVAIARALAAERRLLILDEPTAALTHDSAERLHGVIRALRSHGHAVVFISHRLDEVSALADRITVLRDGCKVSTVTPAEASTGELIRLMLGEAGAEPSLREASAPRSSGEVALEVRGLTREGSFDEISFAVPRGEILGIAGVPGSGREQLVHALVGAEEVDAGEMLVDGRPRRIRSPGQALRHGLLLLPGDRARNGLALAQSLRTNLLLPPGHRAASRGLRRHRREREIADTLLGRVGVKPADPERLAGELSGGNQQRVMVARALYARPQVLIVDEPTQGVDVGGKAAIHQLIKGFADDGAGVIVSSSEVEELEAVCDRVMVMRMGTTVGWVEPAEYGGERLLELALPSAGSASTNEQED
ncbi:MAG: sugar ABC transporter ATP-binding protein [Actinobacteria bacterium]|nr:sugar ABC transporter ATP-binding protein [Actinomycetota bacterium]